MKMTKTNKIISLIMFTFCFLMLTGCASVDYSRFIYPSGEINDRLVVEVDDEAMKFCKVSKQKLFSLIVTDLENSYIQPIENKITEFVNSAENSFEQKQQLLNGINTNIEVIGDKIVCDVTFSNMAVFNLYYHDPDAEENTESEIEFREGAFVNKYVQSSQNAFAVLQTNYLKTFITKYKSLFNNVYDLKDVKLTQVYASPNTSIHSNANDTEISQGIKMHQWEISADNLDFELEFYTVSPHASTWYILALFVSLVVTFVVWGIINRRKMQN